MTVGLFFRFLKYIAFAVLLFQLPITSYLLPPIISLSLQLMGVSGKFSSADGSSWGYSRGCVPLGVGLGHPRCLLASFSVGSLITQWLCPSAWQADPRGTFPEKKPQCTSTDQVSVSSHVLLFHWPNYSHGQVQSQCRRAHTRACHSLTPHLPSFLNMFLSHTLVVRMCCVDELTLNWSTTCIEYWLEAKCPGNWKWKH